ncbi:MAG: arylamine N-acetyltransferase [Caldilineaceae bacterium]
MQLEAYLGRIGFTGSAKADLDTLTALHRRHVMAITYENLDIHLGRTLTLDMAHIFDKIVEQRRGGWCYEMNGLFAWVLAEIGFDVQMLGSRVGSPAQGGDADLDHLILEVAVDGEPWLVDVGFGNGLLEPIPLRVGQYQQGFLQFQLSEEPQAQRWFFHNQPHGGPGFGFTRQPRQYAGFARRCHELQTWPESGFVRATVCHRHTGAAVITLRGAVLREVTAHGVTERIIDNHDDYAQTLQHQFDLALDQSDILWESVWERHWAWQQEMMQAANRADTKR